MLLTKNGITTEKQRAMLARLGFVRVDGLKANNSMNESYVIEARVGDLGQHGYNNSMLSIVTEDRGGETEVWLCSATAKTSEEDYKRRLMAVHADLCPNGSGANVPCSNGEIVAPRDLLMRFSDPDSIPSE